MTAEIVDLTHVRTLALFDELRRDLLLAPDLWTEDELMELSSALKLDEFFGESWLLRLPVDELVALISAAALMARAWRASRSASVS